MGRFLARRLVLTIPVLLGVATLVFSLIHLIPGDPAQAMLGEAAPQSDVAPFQVIDHEEKAPFCSVVPKIGDQRRALTTTRRRLVRVEGYPVQLFGSQDLQPRRVEYYSQTIPATCQAYKALEVRVLSVLGGGLEGFQSRVAGDLAQAPKIYALKTADPFSYRRS